MASMRRRSWIRAALLGLLGLSSATCSSSTTEPVLLNLAGTWSGTVGQSGSGSSLRLTWVATQVNNIVTGTATLVKPTSNVPGIGTLTGTLKGNLLVVTYVVIVGTVPGFPNCAISADGSTMATESTISGSFTLIFTQCAGSGLEPPGSNALNLTKQ